MGSQYAGTAVFPTDFTIPDDGDAYDAASVNVAFEALGDRTAYLRALAETTGVLAIRSVSNVAALKALTGMTSGQVCYVVGTGIYIYVDPDATAESLPWIVQPTSGTGRWFHELNAVRGAASGLATLDTGAKVPVAQIPNAVLSRTYDSTFHNCPPFPSNAPVTLPGGPHVNIATVESGDIIEVEADARFVATPLAAEDLFVSLSIGAIPVSSSVQCTNDCGADYVLTLPFFLRYVCGAGDVGPGVSSSFTASASGASFAYAGVGKIRVTHIRP